MDENTRFLVERMDTHNRELRAELGEIRDSLESKIDSLNSFKHKALGAWFAITTFVSGAVSAVTHWLNLK